MKLKDLLDMRTFVFGCDLHIPSGGNLQDEVREAVDLWHWAHMLRLKMDSRGETVATFGKMCKALKQSGFGVELEIQTRNFSRPEIGRVIMAGCEAGIENFLVFTQDYWISGDSVQESMFFHVDTGKFFSAVDSVRQGYSVDGLPIDGKMDFSIGAGIEPQPRGKTLDIQLDQMKQLADAGIEYFVTNPIFDVARFEQFMNRAQKVGIPVIVEVLMLGSASEARLLNSMSWITIPQRIIERLNKTQFHREESQAIAFELVAGLRDLCSGIHVLPYGEAADIEPVIRSVAR